jgi:hypothetical protein
VTIPTLIGIAARASKRTTRIAAGVVLTLIVFELVVVLVNLAFFAA